MHRGSGRLVEIEEDRSDPRVDSIFPPTKACLRLRGAKKWIYHPERVNFPLKRAGERGEGKWEKIAWDQVIDEIAAKLEEIKGKYGAEAFALTNGTLRHRPQFDSRFMMDHLCLQSVFHCVIVCHYKRKQFGHGGVPDERNQVSWQRRRGCGDVVRDVVRQPGI